MRAVVQRRFGDPEVLEPAELADPVPDREWSVVCLRASALNWHDVLVRQGKYGSLLPHVPGADGTGVDVETGDADFPSVPQCKGRVVPTITPRADESGSRHS